MSGKQVTRKWQDKDGADRYTTEIIANEMQMLDGKSSGESNKPSDSTPKHTVAGNDFNDFDDDIPF